LFVAKLITQCHSKLVHARPKASSVCDLLWLYTWLFQQRKHPKLLTCKNASIFFNKIISIVTLITYLIPMIMIPYISFIIRLQRFFYNNITGRVVSISPVNAFTAFLCLYLYCFYRMVYREVKTRIIFRVFYKGLHTRTYLVIPRNSRFYLFFS